MTDARHLTLCELEAGLDEIRCAPKQTGTLMMIVRRPAVDQREVLSEGVLDAAAGLVGDSWKARAKPGAADGTVSNENQITIMNSRVIALLAQSKERWPLAGDQLYADLDLSVVNLPAGTRLAVGGAIMEVTSKAHTPCRKFAARFGADAVTFTNSASGKQLRLRGVKAKVVQSGPIKTGDVIRKMQ